MPGISFISGSTWNLIFFIFYHVTLVAVNRCRAMKIEEALLALQQPICTIVEASLHYHFYNSFSLFGRL
jgi:hypothetical protein